MTFKKQNSGFTAVEWLITVLVIAAMMGLVVPILFSEKKRVQAEQTIDLLGRASESVFQWLRDTQPILSENGPDLLVGVGAMDPALQARKAGDLIEALSSNPSVSYLTLRETWKGPYHHGIGADPWGNALIVLGLRENDRHLWLISPGVNGKLETEASDLNLGGDDFGVRLR